MKFIITGGAGFIGKNLCNFLLQKGHEVIIIDNFSNSKKSSLKKLKKKIKIIKKDILDIGSIKNIKNIDCLIHLAAKTSVEESFEKPKSSDLLF